MRKFRVNRKLRVLVLLDRDLIPPDDVAGLTPKEMQPWQMEYDVITALRAMGHEVQPIGVLDDLTPLREALNATKPHVVFNVLEEFHGRAPYIHHVVSYLELMKQPYTGCNPRGLTLADDKALSKKILHFHRIPVPKFAVFESNRRVRRPKRLGFPLLVKSLSEHGSVGISLNSLVHDDEHLVERVQFVHRQVPGHVIAEEFIEGREIYLGVFGNQRLETLPPWELFIDKLPEGAPTIATDKVKWDIKYQQKVGVRTGPAADLAPELVRNIARLGKRIYRTLGLSGYARLDFRLRPDGQVFLLEANPNPNISREEDFAAAARHTGISYEELLQRIITLGMTYYRSNETNGG